MRRARRTASSTPGSADDGVDETVQRHAGASPSSGRAGCAHTSTSPAPRRGRGSARAPAPSLRRRRAARATARVGPRSRLPPTDRAADRHEGDHGRRLPDVRFKDLCLDASDPHELAAFWTRVLAPRAGRHGRRRVAGASPDGARGHRHLGRPGARAAHRQDPGAPRPAAAAPTTSRRCSTAGAVLVRDRTDDRALVGARRPRRQPVLRHAAGAAGVGRARRSTDPTPFELNVDCTDAEAQATWWAARTGGEAKTRGGPFWWVEGAAGFPWHVLGLRRRARAEDGEEPDALGRRAPRRLAAGAGRRRRHRAARARRRTGRHRLVGPRRPRGQRVLRLPARDGAAADGRSARRDRRPRARRRRSRRSPSRPRAARATAG